MCLLFNKQSSVLYLQGGSLLKQAIVLFNTGQGVPIRKGRTGQAPHRTRNRRDQVPSMRELSACSPRQCAKPRDKCLSGAENPCGGFGGSGSHHRWLGLQGRLLPPRRLLQPSALCTSRGGRSRDTCPRVQSDAEAAADAIGTGPAEIFTRCSSSSQR